MLGAGSLAPFAFETVEVDRTGAVVRRDFLTGHRFVQDLGDGVALEMVLVAAGWFEIGSPPDEAGRWKAEGPAHPVTVSRFLLARYPTTQAAWHAVARLPVVERELDPDPSYFKGASLPVENVRWHDAVEFCARLAAASKRAFRLPSEAEWEYACRAGTRTPYSCGETLGPALANCYFDGAHAGDIAGSSIGRTTEVGRYPANRFGLHDLHGNVHEWCADAWHFDYHGAPGDGGAWLENGYPSYRPLRGGAWCTLARGCRSAFRTAAHESRDHRLNTYGFRVALSDSS